MKINTEHVLLYFSHDVCELTHVEEYNVESTINFYDTDFFHQAIEGGVKYAKEQSIPMYIKYDDNLFLLVK